MTKLWRIAWHEYSRHVFRRRFIFVLLSVPFFLSLMIGLVILIVWMQSVPTPIGYIDHSGLLANPVPHPAAKFPERNVSMLAYKDETSAKADLESGKLQAYYIIPADYIESGQVEAIYLKELNGIASSQFDSFLAVNLLASQPPEIAKRLLEGNELIVRSTDKSREASQNQIINMILPMIGGVLFIIGMSTTSGYLMQAVVEEKENRTMEIVVTSVSPNQLMVGKVLADLAVGATQLIIWAIFVLLALLIGQNYIPSLSGFKLSVEMVLILLAVMIPAFVMISGLMAAIGATVSEGGEGQQIMGLFTIPIWLPYILLSTFIQNPNSPLAIVLSLFPLTAPMTIAIRLGFTSVPTWQLVASITILVLSAIGALWLAGKAFRLGMLRYGQRLRWKEIFRTQRV